MKVAERSGQYGVVLRVTVIFALLLGLLAHPVRAAENSCGGPTIAASQEVAAAYPDLVSALQTRLARPGMDRCAHVQLRATGNKVMIVITLQDGRSTTRSVEHSSEVADAVEAVLTLPPVPEVSPTPEVHSSAPPSTPQTAPPTKPVATPPSTALPLVQSAPAVARATALEFGIAVSGRFSGQPTYFSLAGSALAQLIHHDWLLAARGHVDPLASRGAPANPSAMEGVPGQVQLKAVGFGLSGGRRLQRGRIGADVTLGADVLVQQQEAAGTRAHAMLIQPRIVAGARLSDAEASPFRLFVGVDIEAWPGRTPAVPDGLSAWPSWTAALSFGVTLEPL